jgi:uncharacterized protein YndB with AHSA1/START domain
MSTDRIEKSIVIHAPRTRVWHALTDAREFGSWFGVALDGRQPFATGARVQGQITHAGYEHLTWDVTIERMEPEHLLAWRWPHPADPTRDDPDAPTTQVVFELEEVAEGTRLTVVESGFDRIPLERRAAAHRDNTEGWEIQVKAIAQHVAGAA